MAGRKLLTPVWFLKQCFNPTTSGRRTLRRAADCRVTPASELKALPRYPGAVSTSLPPLNGNLPVPRTVSVYSRSRFPTEGCTWPFPRFTAAKGNRAAFRTVGSLRGANVFAGLGNYSLNFYESGSATFFHTLLTQTSKRPNLFPL